MRHPDKAFVAHATAYLDLIARDAAGSPIASHTFARPVMLLVWCEDGTCELMTRPDGPKELFAGVLREMANDVIAHPHGYIEERTEP